MVLRLRTKRATTGLAVVLSCVTILWLGLFHIDSHGTLTEWASCETRRGLGPRTHVIYVKVHKTGSTTLRNLFLGFAERRNLSVGFDATNLWGLNWPYEIDEKTMVPTSLGRYDVIANEMVYRKETIVRLAWPDSVYVVSLRHPVENFMSLFKYARLPQAVARLANRNLTLDESISIFVNHFELISRSLATYAEEEMVDRFQVRLVMPNVQMFDLGLQLVSSAEPDWAVRARVEATLQDFDVIILSEYFDESMVLLKRAMCWDLSDVLYISVNARRKEHDVLSNDSVRLIESFNRGDLILYAAANATFWSAVRAMGQDFYEDLREFRTLLLSYTRRCTSKRVADSDCLPTYTGYVRHYVERIRRRQRAEGLNYLRRRLESVWTTDGAGDQSKI